MEITDKQYPHLVSFPRTGSHWLRAMIEFYVGNFNKDFNYQETKKRFTYKHALTVNHIHDFDLTMERHNVIYMYRNIFDTIYSAMVYYRHDINDYKALDSMIEKYIGNLSKWLFDEKFITKKTIVSYDKLMSNRELEFEKICNHLEIDYDKDHILGIDLSKEYISDKTNYDHKIVNISDVYKKNKEKFRIDSKEYIYDKAFSLDLRLKELFENEI